MIGDRVVKTSRSGTRLILIRLRLATTSASLTADRRCVIVGACVIAGACLGARPSSSAAWPVSDEEHVVEGRPAQADVGDGDAVAVQPAQRLDQDGGAAGDRRPRATGVPSSTSTSPRRPSGVSSRPRTSQPGSSSATVSSSRSPPTWALSSSAVPSAITLPWSITTISSASRSASSRYCVVSSRVVPPATSSCDDVPHLGAAARVEAGRRLVEEQHRRVGRPARRPGRAGAACRRSRS